MKFLVDLNKVEDVKDFVRIAEKYDTDITVGSQNKSFLVDGTSLMGVFSLDLSQPVVVNVSDKCAGDRFKEEIIRFVM